MLVVCAKSIVPVLIMDGGGVQHSGLRMAWEIFILCIYMLSRRGEGLSKGACSLLGILGLSVFGGLISILCSNSHLIGIYYSMIYTI